MRLLRAQEAAAPRISYSVPEVAAMMGVPERTVRTWTATGVLPVLRLHEQGKRGRVLIPADGLADALAKARAGGRAG